jgi:hypothetical protein
MRRVLVLLAACGGSQPAPPPPAPAAVVAHEQAPKRDVVAEHRKLEEQQQDALAASCDGPQGKAPRCQPSCYAPAAPDPRAGKKVRGPAEIQHLVCQRDATWVIADDLDPKLAVRAIHGRPPKLHKKGTWQADIELALPVVVTGARRDVTDPITKEPHTCVAASQFVAALKKPLDACGGIGDVVCEAGGNAAAHGLDVVHFRLAEAKRLQASGNTDGCQQAALEALAVAHGMPRWRQYAKLNVDQWPKNDARFRTRFDGVLDEDTLFDTAASLGADAEGVYAACGGAATPSTEQEQSFHTCW